MNRFLVATLLLASISACTVFGVETKSTKTEYKSDESVAGRLESIERRLDALEKRLDERSGN
jgi:hypothetical protein